MAVDSIEVILTIDMSAKVYFADVVILKDSRISGIRRIVGRTVVQ